MLWEAVVLGIIQGLTEFLPVSSSAHLTVVPAMLHWDSPWLNSLPFDVALHVGTLLALASYFWKDMWQLGRAWLTRGWTAQALRDPKSRLAWWVVVATLPAVVVGIPFEKKLEHLFRAPLSVGLWLAGAGLLLGLAEYASRKDQPLERMTLGQALAVGAAQALALIPGVSRSGITITAGLFAGFTREAAARFAFLLAIPVTAGAVVFKLKVLLKLSSTSEIAATVAGVATSAVVGWLCIHFLLAYLRRSRLYGFVIYRLIVGAAIVAWVLLQSHRG